MSGRKIISWTPEEWESKLSKRLEACNKHFSSWADQMTTNANVIYNAFSKQTSQFNVTFDNVIELESGEVDEGDNEVGTNYAWRYTHHKLGQLSANPPSCIATPTSSDFDDKQKADAADHLIRHGYKDQKVQDIWDKCLQKTLVRGIGYVKLCWDKDAGDKFDVNEETQEINMHGDFRAYSPSSMDIRVDPVAPTWDKCRYVFERHYIPFEEALFKFPKGEKILRGTIVKSPDSMTSAKFTDEEVVEIWEYWEKGHPSNGMAGRYAWCDKDGKILCKPGVNPHIHAKLPYYFVTDIEVEDEIYGKSHVEYVSRQQDVLNRFDSASVDAMEFHGNIRMLIPESAEINDDEVSNSNADIYRYSGAIPPHIMPPGQLPPDLPRLREQMRADVQELSGINDAQLGNIKRETSGFAQQTSIEAGNIANRRLFNKYTMAVEAFWKDYLGLIRKHWSDKRKVLVMGKNKAFQAYYYSGADIEGGFDVKAEYGTSLPLDPNMRREQLMLLMEPLQQAGIPMSRFLTLLKLDDLGSLYDELEQGEDRQSEIFNEMIAVQRKGLGDAYIPPEELENHESYLIFATKYRNSMEFKALHPDTKVLIDDHIRQRMEMAANVAGQGQSAPSSQAAPAAEEPGLPAQIMPTI